MTGPDDGVDVELDLLERYQWMVTTQIETLHGIDEKAATILRIEAVLLGILITGFSLLSRLETYDLESGIGFVWLFVGFVAFLLSMGYAIVTYLSSRFLYGPTRHLGAELVSHAIPAEDYRNFLLAGYSETLEKNRAALRRNSRRFRNTLELLLTGIVALSLSTLLLTVDLHARTELLISALVAVEIVLVTGYIHREGYLTIPHEDFYHE